MLFYTPWYDQTLKNKSNSFVNKLHTFDENIELVLANVARGLEWKTEEETEISLYVHNEKFPAPGIP